MCGAQEMRRDRDVLGCDKGVLESKNDNYLGTTFES
jgi:hypothetical protein